ncbi:MAG TPA: cytochrome c oxidase subunit II [Phnomibacter sp.]|nr:cytochrome c oxidase subunit II [Phnomibacter sp.]
MNIWLLLLVVAMIFLVIFQIAKASEYVSVLKGEKKTRSQSNKVNAYLMLAFLILGLIGAYWCNESLKGQTLFAQGSASIEGEKIDSMFMLTLAVTGIVFVITQVLLFWFSFKYREKEGRTSFYFAHSTKLEVIWTAIPAITLTVLVVFGLRHWLKITGPAPKDAMVVEITGQQFGWTYRYPGDDGVLGKRNYKLINPEANNGLGQDWEDKANHDDLIPTTMYLVKGKPVKLVIGSKDVIHDVGLPHFRLKMDAVPGIPTTLWFTPKWTTEEMREKTGNPDFEYEIVCDQLCGASHYAMRGVIKVVSQADYDAEMIKVKPNYFAAFPEKDPAKQKELAPVVADTTKPAATAAVVVPSKSKI